jgi:hypothetical protein
MPGGLIVERNAKWNNIEKVVDKGELFAAQIARVSAHFFT